MTEPKINPKTGHEDSLPNPRPRPDIYKELVASYQVNPQVQLDDVYYRMQFIMADLGRIIQREMESRKNIRPSQKNRK